MLGAETMWGLSAPVGKAVLASGIAPLLLTEFRMLGAAVLFWTVSLFTKKEEVSSRDLLSIAFASLLGIIFNQGMFIFGLSLTSPVNASVITTSSPIITMIIAALFLGEPVTKLKAGGVFVGAIGAFILIAGGSGAASAGQPSSVWGDLLCLGAQVSFACYLVFYKRLTAKYSPVTLMKWMFTYASICVIPFSYNEMAAADWGAISRETIAGIAMVVVGATFVSYILLPVGQRYLRPTITSMYNYVQPVIASVVAVCWGLDSFNLMKGLAVVLVFAGVFMVTKSKSRAQLEAEREERVERGERVSREG